jgi:hypothetical protein
MFPSSVQRLIDNLWGALLPAVLYLGIHLIDDYSHAAGAALHSQPSAHHLIAHFLVLDVGGARRDSGSTDARNHEDHL